jgi:Zn-dependent protease
LLSACLLAALFWDGTGITFCCLLSILLHESGHMLLFVLILHRRPLFKVGIGGIALQWNPAEITVTQQVAILLAGPLANFLAGTASLLACEHRFRLSVLLFGCVNFLLGGFNLLPLGFLDGGKLLELLLRAFLSFPKTELLLRAAETMCLLFLTLLLFFTTGWTARIALLAFLGYYCCKSFFAKN